MTTIEMTAEIVSAYVAHNALPTSELPGLIRSVNHALIEAVLEEHTPPNATIKPILPAVPIAASIGPDFIVCLDTGKKLKSLRRHLTTIGLTPEQYRAKWGLPHDYPMVCPDYSLVRSRLAKDFGLGRPAKAGDQSRKAA